MPVCQRCGSDVIQEHYGYDSGAFGCIPKCGEATLSDSPTSTAVEVTPTAADIEIAAATEKSASPEEARADSASETDSSSVEQGQSADPVSEHAKSPSPTEKPSHKTPGAKSAKTS